MRRRAAFVVLLFTARAAVAADLIVLNPSGQPILKKQANATPWTIGDEVCATAAGVLGVGGSCNTGGGGGSGDITDVWSCTTGNCNALTGASGDSFDAGSADSSKPCVRGTTLPGTCAEGDCFQDTDLGGGSTETYICIATNTWTLLAPADPNYVIIGAATGALTNERRLTAGLGIIVTDNGAGGTLPIAWDPVTYSSNVTLWDSANATRTLTAGLSGASDPVITFGNSSVDVTTGVLKQGGNAVVTVGDSGTVTGTMIADGTVMNGDISATAGIARSKLASGSANHVLINDGSGVMSSETQLAVSRGGTGLAASVEDAVLVGNGSASYQAKIIPDCDTAGTHLQYDQGTNAFSCTADSGAGAEGAGIDITAGVVSWDPITFVNNVTLWNSANATRTLTAGLSGATDPVLTFSDNTVSLTTGDLTVPAGFFDLADTNTATSGIQFALRSQFTADPASATTGIYYGGRFQSFTSATAASGSSPRAVFGRAECRTPNGCGSVWGVTAEAWNVDNTATADVTTMYGVYARINQASTAGTVTTAYSYFAEAPTVGAGGVTNLYGFYQAGTERNSLGGPLELRGSTSGITTLAAGATPATVTYTMPTAAPATNGATLTANTSGQLSWTQRQRKCVSTGSIAAGAISNISVTWDVAYADTTYTVIGGVFDSVTTSIAAIELSHASAKTTTTAAAVLFNRDAENAHTGTLCLEGLV